MKVSCVLNSSFSSIVIESSSEEEEEVEPEEEGVDERDEFRMQLSEVWLLITHLQDIHDLQ